MSTEAWTNDSMVVTRCAGPASEGADRVRWEFAVLDGAQALTTRLRRREVLELAAALISSVAEMTRQA